jgi:hypothetical protein
MLTFLGRSPHEEKERTKTITQCMEIQTNTLDKNLPFRRAETRFHYIWVFLYQECI